MRRNFIAENTRLDSGICAVIVPQLQSAMKKYLVIVCY